MLLSILRPPSSILRPPSSILRPPMLNVRNPRTGEIDAWIVPPSPEALAGQCDRMRQAQIAWQQAGLDARIRTLQVWKQALSAQKEEIVQAVATDTGRWSESVLEFDSVLSSIDRWCHLAPGLLTPVEGKPAAIPFIQIHQQWVPYPLVGVISPWNFPLLLSVIDTIPALLAGCAVVVKPSEIAPRFIQPLKATLAAVPLLQSVLAYIEGAGETGAALIDIVDLVCFTGSVATGKQVAAAAARQFIPAFLELGGKDPAIVLASADLELATSAILWGSVVGAGQSCLSLERVYVQDSIFAPFVARLVEKAKQVQLAYPSIEDGQIGPIISEKQALIVQEHLQDASEKGTLICCGGIVEKLDGGYWCRPTVLTQVNHDMKIMTEETFGPIMPVMPFTSVEEAIHLANDTIYGLSAAVFAGAEIEALYVARHLEAGAISINDAGLTALIHEAEKTAFKFSGMGGSRMGAAALKRFMRTKACLIKTNDEPDPWWFC